MTFLILFPPQISRTSSRPRDAERDLRREDRVEDVEVAHTQVDAPAGERAEAAGDEDGPPELAPREPVEVADREQVRDGEQRHGQLVRDLVAPALRVVEEHAPDCDDEERDLRGVEGPRQPARARATEARDGGDDEREVARRVRVLDGPHRRLAPADGRYQVRGHCFASGGLRVALSSRVFLLLAACGAQRIASSTCGGSRPPNVDRRSFRRSAERFAAAREVRKHLATAQQPSTARCAERRVRHRIALVGELRSDSSED